MSENIIKEKEIDEYYSLSNIVSKDYVCSLDQLNNNKRYLKKTEASEMFFYIINSLNPYFDDSYKKIYYKNENSKIFGFFSFNNKEMEQISNSLKGINVSLKAYIKLNLCHIQYIITEDKKGNNGDLIIIQNGNPENIYYKDGIFFLTNKYDSKLVIYDNKSVYFNSSRKFFPANLKTLSRIEPYIVKIILKYFSTKHFLWKDILNNYINKSYYCPIPLSLIWECHTKKELLERKNKTTLYNSINKHSILYSYLISASLKYIKPNEVQKLNILTEQEVLENCTSVEELFFIFYQKSLNNYDEYYDNYIEDYCFMVKKLKKQFNLKMKSIKKLIEEHDKISLIYKAKFVKAIKIPKNSPFLKLKLPKKYKLIKTKKALVEESILNNNCVASYDTKINQGKCGIYSTIYNKKRYTIEIIYRKRKGNYIFIINQLSGNGNSAAPKELYNELHKLIEKENNRNSEN